MPIMLARCGPAKRRSGKTSRPRLKKRAHRHFPTDLPTDRKVPVPRIRSLASIATICRADRKCGRFASSQSDVASERVTASNLRLEVPMFFVPNRYESVTLASRAPDGEEEERDEARAHGLKYGATLKQPYQSGQS